MFFNRSPHLALATLILGSGAVSHASSIEYKIATARTGMPGIGFSIGYTLGTHEGQASQAQGTASIDLDSANLSQAEFRVPVASMSTGNTKRDCHMLEALGLDYAASSYPEGGHVCDPSNRLPSAGNDSVVFPAIVFKLQGLKAADGTPIGKLERGIETTVNSVAEWTVHGVTQTRSIPLKVIVDTGEKPRILVRGKCEILLRDHGIEVISWGGLIAVKDRAKINLDLELNAL